MFGYVFGRAHDRKWIGNGASLLIFRIISQMPFYIKNSYGLIQSGIFQASVFFMAAVLIFIIFAIVLIQEENERSVFSMQRSRW